MAVNYGQLEEKQTKSLDTSEYAVSVCCFT